MLYICYHLIKHSACPINNVVANPLKHLFFMFLQYYLCRGHLPITINTFGKLSIYAVFQTIVWEKGHIFIDDYLPHSSWLGPNQEAWIPNWCFSAPPQDEVIQTQTTHWKRDSKFVSSHEFFSWRFVDHCITNKFSRRGLQNYIQSNN